MNKLGRYRTWGLAWSLCAAVACDRAEGAEPFDPSGPPSALEGSLLYVDEQQSQALLVDVSDGHTTRLQLQDGLSEVLLRPVDGESTQAVLLSTGRAPDEDNAQAVDAHVTLLDHTGLVAEYPLSGRATSLQLSGDGQYAFVHGSTGTVSVGNRVSIVDLSAAPSEDNPRALQIRSLQNEQPLGAVFSPPMDIAGGQRRLLTVLSRNHVNVLDLSHLEREEITVPLTLPGDAQERIPQQVLFEGRNLYVRSSGGNSVTVLQLNDSEAGTAQDFGISVVELSTSTVPTSITLLQTLDGPRLLALSGRFADVMDPTTGSTTSVPLADPYQDLVRFEGTSPSDPETRARALLWGDGANSVTFVDLENVDARLERSLEVVQLGRRVDQVLPLLARGRVALVHASDAQLSVVELADRTVTPVNAQQGLNSALLDGARERLWLLNPGIKRLGHLGLGEFDTGEVLLDANPTGLFVVDGAEPVIAVTHRGEAGYVTLLNPAEPSRATARSLRGFFWDGLLDEEAL